MLQVIVSFIFVYIVIDVIGCGLYLMDNVIANYFSIMLLSGKPRIQSFLSLNCESTIYIDGTCLKLKVVLTNGFKLTFYQWRAETSNPLPSRKPQLILTR